MPGFRDFSHLVLTYYIIWRTPTYFNCQLQRAPAQVTLVILPGVNVIVMLKGFPDGMKGHGENLIAAVLSVLGPVKSFTELSELNRYAIQVLQERQRQDMRLWRNHSLPCVAIVLFLSERETCKKVSPANPLPPHSPRLPTCFLFRVLGKESTTTQAFHSLSEAYFSVGAVSFVLFG